MALAWLAVLTAMAYVPDITSAAYAPRWWVLVIGAPLAMLQTRAVTLTTGHWLGILFLLVAAESLLWSVSPIDTANGLIQLAALAMVFCVAAEQHDLRPVWLALGFGAIPNVVVALVQTQTHTFVESKGIAGLFFQQDLLGSYCAVALMGLLFGTTGRLAWALATVCLCGLLLSQSRGAMGAACVAVAAMGVLALPTKAKRAWAATAVALLAVIIAVLAYHLMPTRQDAINMRLLEWDWVIQNLHWLGWGYNTLGSVFGFEHADNEFVELAFDLGVASLVFWLLVAHALKGYAHARVCAAVTITLMANSLTIYALRAPATAFVAAVALGGLCGMRHRLRSTGRTRPAIRPPHLGPQRHSGRAADLQRPAVSLSP